MLLNNKNKLVQASESLQINK